MTTAGVIRNEKLSCQTAAREIMHKKDRLPLSFASMVPLDIEGQKVLLEYCHFLSLRVREALLCRLAGHEGRVWQPLFYELCDRAGKDTRLRALALAEASRQEECAYVLRSSLGIGRKEGFLARVFGLAF